MSHRHPPSQPILCPTRTLLPGDLVCERQPQRLGTVLGSCVAVCLWDRHLRFGGMNHFLLPYSSPNTTPSCRFGDVAVPELIERMIKLGSIQRHLQAKLFGGACVLRTDCPEDAVGKRNAEMAIAELRRHRIPIVASRLSGTRGMVIRQCTACGDVWVRPVGVQAPPLAEPLTVPDTAGDAGVAMVVLGDDGLPVAVHKRKAIMDSPWCRTCTVSPYGWRRT